MRLLIILFVMGGITTSCIHTSNIEDRCAKQDLRIESLTIDETNNRTHSKVKCYSALEDNED